MDWSGAAETSWCTTRVCDGSAGEVAALLEGYAAGRTRVMVGRSVLALDEGPTAGGVPTVAAPRVRRARLRYARGRPAARVTVEVAPWSTGRSEVLIRPARRLPPGADAYLAAAVGLLGALVADLGLDRPRAAHGSGARAEHLRRAS